MAACGGSVAGYRFPHRLEEMIVLAGRYTNRPPGCARAICLAIRFTIGGATMRR